MRRASSNGPIPLGAGSGAGGTSRLEVVRMARSAISRLRPVVDPLGARAPTRTVIIDPGSSRHSSGILEGAGQGPGGGVDRYDAGVWRLSAAPAPQYFTHDNCRP